MSIQKPMEITDTKDLPSINSVVNHICQNAAGIVCTSKVPTVKTVQEGQVVIYDDGAGIKRLYFVTGKKNLGYVDLT